MRVSLCLFVCEAIHISTLPNLRCLYNTAPFFCLCFYLTALLKCILTPSMQGAGERKSHLVSFMCCYGKNVRASWLGVCVLHSWGNNKRVYREDEPTKGSMCGSPLLFSVTGEGSCALVRPLSVCHCVSGSQSQRRTWTGGRERHTACSALMPQHSQSGECCTHLCIYSDSACSAPYPS